MHKHRLFSTLNNQHSLSAIATIIYLIHLIDDFDFSLKVVNVVLVVIARSDRSNSVL
ncbi:MAG: hypothetical protein V7K36_10460 [Nostoc sp.]